MKPSRPKVRSNVKIASRSLQLAGTRLFLVFACYLALLTGCGSSDVAFDQAAYQQALQAHNEIHQKTLATIPTGGIAAKVDFPFTASNSFSLVTRSFSFSELSIGAFNDSSPSGVQYQIWPSLTHAFSASNPSVHTEFVIDGVPIDSVVNGVPQVKIVPDGNVMSLTNNQTGDSISLEGLTLPVGANITTDINQGIVYTRTYTGVSHLASGWSAAFSKSFYAGQTSSQFSSQTVFATISFVPPVASPSRIQLTNLTSAHEATNATLDFDITTVNSTLRGWSVEIEQDGSMVKTFAPSDPRGPGTATGSNPVHVRINWDGLDNNNQPVTGNITWVTTANTTNFVAGANLNDGVNSVQSRVADIMDPDMTVTDFKADNAYPFLDDNGILVPDSNVYFSESANSSHPLLLAGDPTAITTSGVAAKAAQENYIKEFEIKLQAKSQGAYDFRLVDPDDPQHILSATGSATVLIPGTPITVKFGANLGTKVHVYRYLKVQYRKAPEASWKEPKQIGKEKVYFNPLGSLSATPFSTSNPPRTAAIDLAYELADGATSVEEVRNLICQRLGPWLKSKHFIYYPAMGHTNYRSWDKTQGINFKSLIDATQAPDEPWPFCGDCHDYASLQVIACAVLGIDHGLVTFLPKPLPQAPDRLMYTNPMRVFAEKISTIEGPNNTAPILRDPVFESFEFGEHQASCWDSKVWDPIGEVIPTGLPTGTPITAIGLDINSYFNSVISSNQAFLGQDISIIPAQWVTFGDFPDPRTQSVIRLTRIDQ